MSTPPPTSSKSQGRPAFRLSKTKADSKDSTNPKSKPKTDKKIERNAAKVREKVLAAALEYFGAFGFEGSATRAIAERAGVTHSLVLYHFKSKEKLWVNTLENALEKLSQNINKHMADNKDLSAASQLKILIEQLVRTNASSPQIYRILTAETNQDTDRLRWIIDHFIQDFYSRARNLIRAGQDEGSVRDYDPARLYYLIISVAGTVFAASSEYKIVTGRDAFSEAEILRNIAFIYEIVFI